MRQITMWKNLAISIAILIAFWASPAMAVFPDCPNDRFEFREIPVGDVTLHVACKGKRGDDKPILIFLHGFPEYWNSWAEVASILSSKFQVLLPDQRGYDLSDKPL